MADHVFEPDTKYPWFCGRCGYGERERLMHRKTAQESITQKPSPWPLMGYAPGKYWHRACSACGDSYDGDKYSWHCLPCAVRAANAEMEMPRRSGREG